MCTVYGLLLHFMLLLFAKIIFLQITLFCREICFVTIYALLCGEKWSKKLQIKKLRNMRYELWCIVKTKKDPERRTYNILPPTFSD